MLVAEKRFHVLAVEEVGSNEDERMAKVRALVLHKEYGTGSISKISDGKIYVEFGSKQRIFSYPEAFEKQYLKLV